MMLVRECAPGDMVEARGWDVAHGTTHPEIGWLIPHNMNHKKSLEEGYKTILLYVGPAYVAVDDRIRKLHNFLTEDGSSVYLEGNEFRCLNFCTT